MEDDFQPRTLEPLSDNNVLESGSFPLWVGSRGQLEAYVFTLDPCGPDNTAPEDPIIGFGALIRKPSGNFVLVFSSLVSFIEG